MRLMTGAGVDCTTGIDFPSDTLLADVTRYLDKPGKAIGRCLACHASGMRFSFNNMIGERWENRREPHEQKVMVSARFIKDWHKNHIRVANLIIRLFNKTADRCLNGAMAWWSNHMLSGAQTQPDWCRNLFRMGSLPRPRNCVGTADTIAVDASPSSWARGTRKNERSRSSSRAANWSASGPPVRANGIESRKVDLGLSDAGQRFRRQLLMFLSS